MAQVVGVVFRGGTKIYHFDPAGLELARGDRVVVQTVNGPEIGQVVEPPHEVDESELPAPLKKVVRLATGEDLEAVNKSEALRKQALETCRRLIEEHGLDMKLVDAEIAFGGEKITFSFVAEERVDFRALVADLAKTLKMRVELRQIGAREEARLVGGLGPCGRTVCCVLFQLDDEPVSIRMAKEQNLPLNPTKISGLCGRLMCCLKFEQDQYVEFRKQAPAKGTRVVTPRGEGVVAGYNFTKESIIVRLEDGTLTNVRLASCEWAEDGKLVVVPEVAEPVPVPWLETEVTGETLEPEEEVAEEGAETLPVLEAEVVLGADGEPVEVIVAEGSRKSSSGRRRRRKRKTQAKTQEKADGQGSAGAADITGETRTPQRGSRRGRRGRKPASGSTSEAGRATRREKGTGRDKKGSGAQQRSNQTGTSTEGNGNRQASVQRTRRSRRSRKQRSGRSGSPGESGGEG
ncbi:MAG: stage 0 sporulation family protein [Thermoleophilia bacterium]|nr:stage 0 sporulation family protein [Thermoleophilia bacterium]